MGQSSGLARSARRGTARQDAELAAVRARLREKEGQTQVAAAAHAEAED